MVAAQHTPWTCIAHVEVVPVFLRWELRSWFILDEVPENGLTSFELARFIGWRDPIGDF